MNDDRLKKLRAEFPEMFRPVKIHKAWSAVPCEISCGNGWYELIRDLCYAIMKCGIGEEFYAVQVKEKFGGLRFYVYGSSDEVQQLINKAEDDSFSVCKKCGSKDGVDVRGKGWIKTLCAECDGHLKR